MYSNVAQGLLFHVWLKSCSEVALLELVARTPHRHRVEEQLRAAEKGEGSAWMQSQSQRHEAQLHFGLVPVYRKILNNKKGNLHIKASFGYFLASISSTPNGKLEMHTSLQAPITLMHSWPMKKKLLQFNYEKGTLNFDVKTIEFLL